MDDRHNLDPIAIFYAYEPESVELYCNAGKYSSAIFDIWNEGYRRIKDAKNEIEEEAFRSFVEFINETIESNGLPGF